MPEAPAEIVAARVLAARAVEPDVDDRPHQRFRDLRSTFVVKAERHAVTLEQGVGFWLVPRRMPELHHMLKPALSRSARAQRYARWKRREECLEAAQVAMKVAGQLIEDGPQARTKRLARVRIGARSAPGDRAAA